MDIQRFQSRKREHLRFALDPAHQAEGLSGLDRIRLIHDALPDLDISDVRLGAPCLTRTLPTPYFIAGMTAGHDQAIQLNRLLARACARRGWALGVGSQRRELEGGSPIDDWGRLRNDAPGLVCFANIGLSQLPSANFDSLHGLVEGLGAQGLVIHANSLQECLQPEGTPRFRGSLARLRELCATLGIPVILKETGCGFSARAVEKLRGFRLAALDVSGLGGTHWGRIEGARSLLAKSQANGDDLGVLSGASETFADWGESTVDSVLAARTVLPEVSVWASGGVRSGLDAAKLIALGAERVGFAKPALEAAMKGEAALDQWMERMEFELKVALFCTGSVSPSGLKGREGAWKPSVS